MTSTPTRSFAGYQLTGDGEKTRFGVEYRAEDAGGDRATVILVDDELAATEGFAQALARSGARGAALSHANVVRVLHVGRGKDGILVVVCAREIESYRLDECTQRPLPQPVALAIARDIASALAYAHTVSAVHGGVHARSVRVGSDGRARLSDWGLSQALAIAAAGSDDPKLMRGLRGHVAPELALGQEPSPSTDVFAAGALISGLFSGSEEGTKIGIAIDAALARALDTDEDSRFKDASAFCEAFETAIADDGLKVASASSVATRILERVGVRAESESLDQAMDGLVSDLEQEAEPRPVSRGKKSTIDGVLDDLDEDTDIVDPGSGELPLAPLTDPDDYTGEHTKVDGDKPQLDEDPISQIIRSDSLSDSHRSVPEPETDFDDDQTPLPNPRPFHLDPTMTISTEALKRRHSSIGDDSEVDIDGVAKKRSALFWVAVMVFAAATGAGILYTQTDLFSADRASARQSDRDRIRRNALADLENDRKKPGSVAIATEGEDAAIWLLLGRTPVTSFPLPSSMVHELRLEHDGYHPVDLRVTATHWSGPKDARVAHVSATLVEGKPEEAAPAFPPEPDSPAAPGGPGMGQIEVSSSPEGAAAWMLVGFGPSAEIGGIAAGHDYEFRVLRAGYRPAFLSIKADEWLLSGKGGPVVPRLEREVPLQAEAQPEGKPAKRPRKRRDKHR